MNILNGIFGINWATTSAGVMVIIAAIGRIALAWKAKDFESILTDGQLLLSTLLAVAAGLGLMKAKDSNVTGAGAVAKAVDSEGTVTNIEGDVIGSQPIIPPSMPRL